MKKRAWVSLLAIVVLLAVYGYEYVLDAEENTELISEGQQTKSSTNEYFLPTSTTQQIIHHNGYSLSYSEQHEQAEWVAYELKKSHLSNSNHKRPYFEVDKAVKTGAASWRNYKGSGYDMKTIGKEYVAVPNQFYKVLIDTNSGTTKMIAFLMPHKDSKKPLYEFVVSVDTIEQLTGIDFFPELEDGIERKLEASSSYKGWSF